MGPLTLPASGVVYVDANAIIYRVEQIELYLTLTKPIWEALDAGTQDVVTSELSLLEVLVKPFRLNDTMLATLFVSTLYGTPGFRCHAVTRPVLEQAAQLRVTTNLKTPDSIHAATALYVGCTLFVTNDAAFRRVPGLPVVVLSDIAAAP